MTSALQPVDWIVIIIFVTLTFCISLYFAKRAGKNIESFFVSGRSLPWYIAGISFVAAGFASDTPIWVSSLIRKYGVYYLWQFCAPFLGGTLAVVLFARLWRRMGIITDIEFIEQRYSGKAAGYLRFLEGTTAAFFFCPLVLGWVIKAMEVIGREAMGLSPEYRIWTTAVVVGIALVMCTAAGLGGIVYADFLQFVVATVGTIILAVLSVRQVGGLNAMLEKLSTLKEWGGPSSLQIMPDIGPGPMQMSVWNAIGYFGILWISVSLSGGYMAQRLLACKNGRHSTLAILTFSVIYYGLICWPWVLVALCSLILFPQLGESVSHDVAYPRMIAAILPVGLRGMVVAAMLAAFISTINMLFNWGASYIINDVYKRFINSKASSGHYVLMSRVATIALGAAGGTISFMAGDIQQLLAMSYVIGAGVAVVRALRWFWWRINAVGDLAATISIWVLAMLIIFTDVLDLPARFILGLDPEAKFSTDPDLMGARMFFVTVFVTAIAVIVSCLTKPTDKKKLEAFIFKARPFHFFWKPVIRQLGCEYYEGESFRHTLISWIIASITVGTLIFGMGKLLLGSPVFGVMLLAIFIVGLYITVRRINKDFSSDLK